MPQTPLATAAIDRPLRLRMRPDLAAVEQWFAGRRHFVIKDPLARKFSHLTEQEFAVLSLLDGQTSFREIQEQFAERFAPQQLTSRNLQAFLAQLHRQGLVLGEAPGQAEQFARRRGQREQFSLLKLAEKLLALRWRGIDPQPLLAVLEPKLGWLFSRSGFALWLPLVIGAVLLLVTRLDEVARRLPDAASWLAGPNLVWLAAATILVKTLHEMGHALAAQRLGCRPREIGVQLFFLLPCVYTDVSDAWMLPSKWRRMAISAAGIYVELLLAAVATLVWWWAQPGVLSSLCLNVMFVASVGTLLLNGNPLMRYDGYYLLADLIEVPNLEQRSRTQLLSWLARWCLGTTWQAADTLDPRPRPLLALYAAAALAWRVTVIGAVYYAVRGMLAPYRLEAVSDVLLAGAIVGMVVPLATALGQLAMQAHRRNELRPLRVVASLAIVAAVLAGICLVPLPQRITAPAVVEPRGAGRVYVTVAGTLQSALPPGTRVERGEAIATLQNLNLERDLARLESERRQQALHLTKLQTLRGDDPSLTAAIPAAEQSLVDLDARIEHVRALIERLTLRAPRGGIVLPPPRQQATSARQQAAGARRQLAAWQGTPLDEINRGSFLESGTLVCQVAPPDSVEAVAVVDQADLPLVEVGRAARVAMPQGTRVVRGTVEVVARLDSDELPLTLAATGAIPQQTDASGQRRPLTTAYQVRIRLDDSNVRLLPGTTGRVSIIAPPQPLATRLVRWLGRTFRFRS